jgi:hypothetical protein
MIPFVLVHGFKVVKIEFLLRDLVELLWVVLAVAASTLVTVLVPFIAHALQHCAQFY